ncbi:EscU/YscU/HrcU family type III secretion system export apparatus switch protein [Leptospirillum ferrooxidans]|jgi:type III secretion system FlhB-like substrate exporter|uniref:Putative flagellar biosynthesis protein n=1 Tax=Leptospirillum ferrooxidans (strain C2-3) TaxID=1162668 RepID=I0IL72_LEPFC|nr:EscU/YscU/HrcU family type III secretion system export apparatus switch protein [Leptospirillum ferrooxidans]BAM06021.1 putative flagellar biosynthesis protein [Leptospirillum ferrooxidans C2-3]
MDDPEKLSRLAIAIRYLPGEDGAPVVLASGKGEVAKAILEQASLYKIPVTENPPLAKMLIGLPLDHPIPVEFYEAVALVLAHLYRYPGGEKESGTKSAP